MSKDGANRSVIATPLPRCNVWPHLPAQFSCKSKGFVNPQIH